MKLVSIKVLPCTQAEYTNRFNVLDEVNIKPYLSYMTPLLTLLTTLALGQPAPREPLPAAPASMHLIAQNGTQLTLQVSGDTDHRPGDTVGVYLWELRPDPRSDGMISGSRYAGDGRVLWMGGDLVMLELVNTPASLNLERPVQLGEARRAPPTQPWTPPAPLVAAVAPSPPPPERQSTIAHQSTPIQPEPKEQRPSPIGDARATHYDGRRQQFTTAFDWSDDGHQTGTGLGEVTWSMWPKQRLGALHISLQGLRGMRWVSPDSPTKNEPWARTPATGYWLWTRVETTGVNTALTGGFAVGVDTNGPTAAASIGLRLGASHTGHVRLTWDQYGDIGYRGTMLGMVPLSPKLRVGLRTRAGALATHESPEVIAILAVDTWQQVRADGTLRIAWDLSHTFTLNTGAGLAGYDLIAADAGPVVDGALEIRW